LVLFSVDTIEKDEFVLEKDENQALQTWRGFIFFQLKKFKPLIVRRAHLKQRQCGT
jgi:hypothetical protein